MSVSILLADDHHVVRKGIRALLEAESDFQIVGEATDGLQAIELVERLRPAIIILDIMMPGLNGLEVARRISHAALGTRVVVLSMHSTEGYVLDALRNGVSGYVLKDATQEELAQAIRQVAIGERYLSPQISERAIEAYVQKARLETPQDPYMTLTNREREVLQMAAEGLSNQEIASRLSISPRTVETHRANLMQKLSLGSYSDLIRFAIKKGLIE
jgi:two-component system, NarL family, response regulator NreC